jgi:hypothetical protein
MHHPAVLLGCVDKSGQRRSIFAVVSNAPFGV